MAAIAKNYCEALFSLALEEDQLKEYNEQLSLIETCLKENRDFKAVLNHPKIKKEEKKAMLRTVFQNSVSVTVLNFMQLLIDKTRFMQMEEIIHEFHKSYHKAMNIQVVYVKSAVALEEEQKQALEQKLEKELAKKVECVYRVDPDLLAGMRVKINDKIYDNSAAGRLQRLKKQVVLSDLI